MPGTLIAPAILERLAIDDLDVVAVADVEELLVGIRGQREIAGERRVGLDQLLEELAVAREHLHAPVFAVGHIDGAVFRDAHRVHDAEVLRAGPSGKLLRSDHLAVVVVAGVLPNAPHIRLNAPVSASNTMTR